MKILIVHNRYAIPGRGSGEEVSLSNIEKLLKNNGHTIIHFTRSSLEIMGPKEQVKAFFSGIYNPFTKKQMVERIDSDKPDLVLIQNVYPLISPSVLSVIRRRKVSIVMRCPNYRLICPNGLLLSHGQICESCVGGREYWCIIKNCENNYIKSFGYALRNIVARRLSLFNKNVNKFMVLTEFAKNKMIGAGFDKSRIEVIYSTPDLSVVDHDGGNKIGSFVGFVGRLSSEKGIKEIIETAKNCPHIPFKFAGGNKKELDLIQKCPKNVEMVGQLDATQLSKFYKNSRFIVVPSKCYEGLPLVALEAMLNGKPLICSNLGAFREIVDHQKNGLLFDPFKNEELTKYVKYLWKDHDACVKMGKEGKYIAQNIYSPQAFYSRIINVFNKAIEE